jgi:hypothetical protein
VGRECAAYGNVRIANDCFRDFEFLVYSLRQTKNHDIPKDVIVETRGGDRKGRTATLSDNMIERNTDARAAIERLLRLSGALMLLNRR